MINLILNDYIKKNSTNIAKPKTKEKEKTKGKTKSHSLKRKDKFITSSSKESKNKVVKQDNISPSKKNISRKSNHHPKVIFSSSLTLSSKKKFLTPKKNIYYYLNGEDSPNEEALDNVHIARQKNLLLTLGTRIYKTSSKRENNSNDTKYKNLVINSAHKNKCVINRSIYPRGNIFESNSTENLRQNNNGVNKKTSSEERVIGNKTNNQLNSQRTKKYKNIVLIPHKIRKDIQPTKISLKFII